MSEDILAKYRRKSPGSVGEQVEVKVKPSTTLEQPPPMYPSLPFNDAKKKLRLVLSNAELQQIPDVLPAMVSTCHTFFVIYLVDCKMCSGKTLILVRYNLLLKIQCCKH